MSNYRFTCHSTATSLRALVERTRHTDGTVLGTSPTAAYLGFDDSVVALTARAVPLMPNGASIIESAGLGVFKQGAAVHASRWGVCAGRVEVTWETAMHVDLAVPRNEGYDARAVALRGRDLLGAMEHDADPVVAIARACPALVEGDGLEGVRLLLAALISGEPEVGRAAASMLTGRGPGLTPDGDDLLAAAAASTLAFEGPAGADPEVFGDLRAVLVVDDLRDRTGALSATLLRLAAEGQVIDPVRSLLDLSVERPIWLRALGRLGRIGHSTGTTYALGCALAAVALTTSSYLTK